MNNMQKLNNNFYIRKLIASNKNVWKNFLNYNKRFEEEKIKFNDYINNNSFINSTKYLHNNLKTTLFYLVHYAKTSNLLCNNELNNKRIIKLFLFIKNSIYVFVFGLLFTFLTIILFIINSIKSIYDIIISLFILKNDKINKENGKINYINSRNNLHNYGYFDCIQRYYKHFINKIINRIHTYSNSLDKGKNIIIFYDRIIDIFKLLSPKTVLINVMNNIKNMIIKINEDMQIKYIRNLIENQINNINNNRPRTILQIRNNIETELRNKINKPLCCNELNFNKIVQSKVNYEIENQKLQLLFNNKVMLNILSKEISKSIMEDVDEKFFDRKCRKRTINKCEINDEIKIKRNKHYKDLKNKKIKCFNKKDKSINYLNNRQYLQQRYSKVANTKILDKLYDFIEINTENVKYQLSINNSNHKQITNYDCLKSRI